MGRMTAREMFEELGYAYDALDVRNEIVKVVRGQNEIEREDL